MEHVNGPFVRECPAPSVSAYSSEEARGTRAVKHAAWHAEGWARHGHVTHTTSSAAHVWAAGETQPATTVLVHTTLPSFKSIAKGK